MVVLKEYLRNATSNSNILDLGDESDTDDAKSNEDTNSTPEVPILRPQELRLDLIEEPTARGLCLNNSYCAFFRILNRVVHKSICLGSPC